MGGHASKDLDGKTLWGGKVSPFGASYGKLMMWFFLVSDALTFGGLLTAFAFIRHSYDGAWPVGEQVFHHFPFMGETPMPLIYVAFMTFILIVSSVTMVLAVEAGHRNDDKGVKKWLFLTVIGGFIFLGSQVWEWSHFIHGSHFGKVQLHDGSWATVEGDFGAVDSLVLMSHEEHAAFLQAQSNEFLLAYEGGHGAHDDGGHGHDHGAAEGHGHGHGHGEAEDDRVITGGDADHEFRHALAAGHLHVHGEEMMLTNEEGKHYRVYKQENKIEALVVREGGSEYSPGDKIEGEKADSLYQQVLKSHEAGRVIYGANLKRNEYGPSQYGQFFFFITGFHGFHVFSGVLINLIILIRVFQGLYKRRGHYEMIEKVGLYWHFVDLVWVFVFTFFYLI